MKKRMLVDAYYAMNLGDDLFLKVLFDRYPDMEWELLTPNKEYNKIFKDYNNVNIISSLSVKIGRRKIDLFSRLNNKILNYYKYDALVIVGGSIFMESQKWKEQLDSNDYLPNKFKTLNKEVFILGSNFGPFKDELFISKHREFFSQLDDICFRDHYSHNIFKGLNNVRVASDVVFNLDIKEIKDIDRDQIVGISIIDIKDRKGLKEYYHCYNDMLIKLIERFIELGYEIKLFSFCKQEGDLNAIKYIENNLNEELKEHINIVSYEGDIYSFLNSYNTCEIIIGTRFHSVILSILLNQNIFPIIYSEKTYNMLKDLKMENKSCYVKDIKDLDVNEVIENTIKVENNNALKSDAKRQFEKLDLFIYSLK